MQQVPSTDCNAWRPQQHNYHTVGCMRDSDRRPVANEATIRRLANIKLARKMYCDNTAMMPCTRRNWVHTYMLIYSHLITASTRRTTPRKRKEIQTSECCSTVSGVLAAWQQWQRISVR